MRQKVKRRWFACLWTIFLVFLFWWFISVARRNVQASYGSSSSTTVQQVAPLKVIVVEERQEVLIPWVNALSRGLLQGNATLVLLCSQAHEKLPSLTVKFPGFRLPKTEEEVDQMIQGNDYFLGAAQISHLVSRSVWIYPFWNTQHDLYRWNTARLGLAFFNGVRTICECPEPKRINSSCYGPQGRLPSHLCERRRDVVRETIRDVYARTRMPAEKNWLGGAPLLLDIDEDFFGVRLVGSQLVASGLAWAKVETLQRALMELFCPNAPEHERLADRWFFRMLQTLRNCGASDPWCSEGDAAVAKFLLPLRASAIAKKMFCSHDRPRVVDLTSKRAFLRIWGVLRSLRRKQLDAVQRAGVCFTQSVRSLEPPKLRLCIGHNTPNDSAVMEHYPSREELSQQFERLRAILQALPSRPRLITIARSSRDGYVPRDLQTDIERGLVKLLREVFSLKDDDLVFDNLLLNGRQGDWFNRQYAD